ncbi:MAG: permease prefix domain 1-containing protein [Erysipelotrichaceae bacterium]
MNAKIRTYITRAFEDVPKTKKSIEMQEELISNLNEKFNDQVASGKTEDEAYTMVIAGIGDLSELTEGLIERHVLSAPNQQQRQKNALFITIAVMLYIMSPMMVVFCAEILKAEVLGIVLMFTLIAIATGLLVYNFNSRPKYIKESETMIEEFKEWKSAKDKNKSLFDALNSAFWLIIVAAYLYISIMYGWWLFSWIIFIIASAVKNIFKAIYDLVRYSNESK